MFKLVIGDLYRIFHKKSVYGYLGFLAFGYSLLAYIRSSGFNTESVVADASQLFFMTPIVVGTFFFSMMYTDDLQAKNLVTLVGYGLSKVKIVLAKIVCSTILCTLFFALLPLVHSAIYWGLGYMATIEQLTNIYFISLQCLLMTVAYFSLSSVVVYGIQQKTVAVVTYLLLALGVVRNIISVIGMTLSVDLSDHLISGLTSQIIMGIVDGNVPILPITAYLVWMSVTILLATMVFNKKEMEL